MTGDRPTALLDLIELRGPIDQTIEAARNLRACTTAEASTIVLTRLHLLAVLDTRRTGRMEAAQVQRWAQAMRLHIARGAQPARPSFVFFDPAHDDAIARVLYSLAAERHDPYQPGLLVTLRGAPWISGPTREQPARSHRRRGVAAVGEIDPRRRPRGHRHRRRLRPPELVHDRALRAALMAALTLAASTVTLGLTAGRAAARRAFTDLVPVALGLASAIVVLNAVGWLP